MVCPVVNSRCTTARTASTRSGSSAAGGTRYGIRATAIFFFARVIRAAMVGLADQEGAGHVGGGQPAHQPQGQRHLRRPVQRRVAAGDDQPQPVVGQLGVVRPVVEQLAGPRHGVVLDQQRQVPPLHAPVPDDVERAAPGRRRQPGTRAAPGCRGAASR